MVCKGHKVKYFSVEGSDPDDYTNWFVYGVDPLDELRTDLIYVPQVIEEGLNEDTVMAEFLADRAAQRASASAVIVRQGQEEIKVEEVNIKKKKKKKNKKKCQVTQENTLNDIAKEENLTLNEVAKVVEENVTSNEVAAKEGKVTLNEVVEDKINTVHDETDFATAPKILTDRKSCFPEFPDSIIKETRRNGVDVVSALQDLSAISRELKISESRFFVQNIDDERLRISLEIDPVQWFKAKLSEFWEGPGSPSPEDEVNAVYFQSLRRLLENCDNYISQERQKEYAEQENMTKETGDSTCSDCKFRKSGRPKMLVQCKKHLKTFGNTWTPCRWRQESSNIIYSSVDGFFQLVLYSTFEQRCIVTVNPESLTCPVHTDEDVEQSVEFWNFVFECMDHIRNCCGASVPYLMMNRGSWESEIRRQKNYIMNCHAHVHLVLPAAVTKIKIFESFTGSVDFSRKQNVDDLENEIARYRRQLSRLEDLRLQKDINWLKDDMKEMKKEIVTVKDDMKEMKQKMTSLEINISKILKHLKIE